MNQEKLLEETAQTIKMLYQNREHESIQNIVVLFPIYQEVLQTLLTEADMQRAAIYLQAVKELLECYQTQDMIGMADNLQWKILPILSGMKID